jgi:hypothetical protein
MTIQQTMGIQHTKLSSLFLYSILIFKLDVLYSILIFKLDVLYSIFIFKLDFDASNMFLFKAVISAGFVRKKGGRKCHLLPFIKIESSSPPLCLMKPAAER